MPDLYPDDQRKVDEYIQSNVNKVPRRPFYVWRLLAVIFGVLVALTLVSYWIARNHGMI